MPQHETSNNDIEVGMTTLYRKIIREIESYKKGGGGSAHQKSSLPPSPNLGEDKYLFSISAQIISNFLIFFHDTKKKFTVFTILNIRKVIFHKYFIVKLNWKPFK